MKKLELEGRLNIPLSEKDLMNFTETIFHTKLKPPFNLLRATNKKQGVPFLLVMLEGLTITFLNIHKNKK